MAYKTILLDLDGTLTDSKDGIFKSLRHAFSEMGLPVPTDESLMCFIGPPLPESLRRYCNLDEVQIVQAMELFRQRYTSIGKYENTPTPGMLEMCQRLREAGYLLALASSKPEVMCCDICEKFGFTTYLHVVAGSSLEEHGTKADVIQDALNRLGVSPADYGSVLMVGDREFDVLGAKQWGIDCAGVEFFDYAAKGELERSGAKVIVKSVAELEAWILQ